VSFTSLIRFTGHFIMILLCWRSLQLQAAKESWCYILTLQEKPSAPILRHWHVSNCYDSWKYVNRTTINTDLNLSFREHMVTV